MTEIFIYEYIGKISQLLIFHNKFSLGYKKGKHWLLWYQNSQKNANNDGKIIIIIKKYILRNRIFLITIWTYYLLLIKRWWINCMFKCMRIRWVRSMYAKLHEVLLEILASRASNIKICTIFFCLTFCIRGQSQCLQKLQFHRVLKFHIWLSYPVY